jgi:ANTAR domain
MPAHAVIVQAVGVVIALEGVRSEQAFAMLKEVSQTTNVKLRTIAKQVVDAAQGGAFPRPLGRRWVPHWHGPSGTSRLQWTPRG